MRSEKELNELKKEYEALTEKCRELTEDELAQVTGGGTQHMALDKAGLIIPVVITVYSD